MSPASSDIATYYSTPRAQGIWWKMGRKVWKDHKLGKTAVIFCLLYKAGKLHAGNLNKMAA